MSFAGKEISSYFIQRAKDVEETNPYEAKSWLLIGKSLLPKSFHIQFQAYLLEKRLRNVQGSAQCFESLFMLNMKEEIGEVANAVRTVQLTKGKETDDQQFLQQVFSAVSKDVQMEVLMQRSENTTVLFEKCQFMLLIVQLYPDTVNQHGAELLFTLLACESDAFSTFRKLLVVELVPALLRVGKNLGASPHLITLLNQCIEYYILVAGSDKKDSHTDNWDRWEKLFSVVDQIGCILSWKIAPFFGNVIQNSGSNNVDALYQALVSILQHRNHYTHKELGYITLIIFLRCIVAYTDLIHSCSPLKLGENSKLVLVEIFTPGPHSTAPPDPNLPVITTVSNCGSVGGNQTQVLQYFLTASKIWQMINTSKGDRLEKEFFLILKEMNSINFKNWNVFQEFTLDYHTYSGQHFPQDSSIIQDPLKLACLYCSVNNFKLAAEYAIESVSGLLQTESGMSTDVKPTPGGQMSSVNENKEDFNFFNDHLYKTDQKGNLIMQRRVHFLSENKAETIAYAANVLIQCFCSALDVSASTNDDRCLGHLMTLLQLEWPSPPAEILFIRILEIIRSKGAFSYVPYFSDYVIEPDFLEQFMAMVNQEGKTVNLDLWTNNNGNVSSGRMGTRGVEKGVKNDFRQSMRRQMMKNERENLDLLIVRFLTLNKADILSSL